MKKHGLLKILGIMILLMVIASYFLPSRQNTIAQIGLADILLNYFSVVLANFGYLVLFILSVGGFYGVLNKTNSYKKLLDTIVTKVKPLNKKFIYMIIIIFAVVTSLTSITIPLFIFIPFVTSIILLLGYDKLVALSSTVGSIIVGYIGGVFINFVNPKTYEITTYDEFVGLESKFANTFPKLLLLFSGIALLIYFINQHIKNVEEKKVKYDLTDNNELLISEVKGNYKDIKIWPLIIVLSVLFIITILGMVPWKTLFEIEAFENFHEWLIGLKISKFPVLKTIISGNLPALGGWLSSGNPMAAYVYLSMFMVFMTIIVTIIGRVKLDNAIDNYMDGIKKLLPTVALITVAYNVLVFAYNNGFLETIITNSKHFNYGISSLLALLGSIIYVDTTWIMSGSYVPIINLITDESIYPSVSVLLQGIYGVALLAGPTSLILIIGMTYLDIPYITWLKYIWRFVLALLILIALVTLLVVLL